MPVSARCPLAEAGIYYLEDLGHIGKVQKTPGAIRKIRSNMRIRFSGLILWYAKHILRRAGHVLWEAIQSLRIVGHML